MGDEHSEWWYHQRNLRSPEEERKLSKPAL